MKEMSEQRWGPKSALAWEATFFCLLNLEQYFEHRAQSSVSRLWTAATCPIRGCPAPTPHPTPLIFFSFFFPSGPSVAQNRPAGNGCRFWVEERERQLCAASG